MENAKAVSDEGCQVVVVFCGEKEWAKVWKKDVNCPFQIVIDSSRDLYYHYGMRRSVRKVFCQEAMEYYINYKSSGGTFPNPYPGDDPTQSGGDIVFNKEGEVEYMHLCKTIVDRPLVSEVISALGKLRK